MSMLPADTHRRLEPPPPFYICAGHEFNVAPAARLAAEASEPDGRLHMDGYFTWHRRNGYVLDRRLPCDFYLAPPALHAQQQAASAAPSMPHPWPLAEWDEEDGAVLWWRFPVDEPPYVGSPLCDDWPGYHTHWTRIVVPAAPTTGEG